MNISRSIRLIGELARLGVGDIVYCAGARNSPIVKTLENTTGFDLYSFFEERSAAFFALGLSRRRGRPAAIVTTSGTAAAELLPAAIEAYYSGVPLILITADRPRRLRATGAPQCIDQIGLFRKFVSVEYDFEENDKIELPREALASSIHVNICFDEPLIDETVPQLKFEPIAKSGALPGASGSGPAPLGEESAAHGVREWLAQRRHPIAVVGSLESVSEREAVVKILEHLRIPSYLEGPSGLREDPRLRDMRLRGSDRILSWAIQRPEACDGIIRLGGVPTARIWRDLEMRPAMPVLSLSRLQFSGLSQSHFVQVNLERVAGAEGDIESWLGPKREASGAMLLDFDGKRFNDIEAILQREPRSEPALVRAWSKLVPTGSTIYIGNSLPIREWDLAASWDGQRPVFANRGANGIDGQLSTFLGLAREDRENWAMVGDLTTMYDLTAPWALSMIAAKSVRITVMNNGGGKIFSRIFRSSLFENAHDLRFEAWAKMWGLSYAALETLESLSNDSSSTGSALPGSALTAQLIELRPDPAATERFWDSYDRLWVEK